MPHIMKAKELVDQGRIGRVFKVHLTWNRNTRSRMRRDPLGVDPKQVDWKAFLGGPRTAVRRVPVSQLAAGSGISAAACSPT